MLTEQPSRQRKGQGNQLTTEESKRGRRGTDTTVVGNIRAKSKLALLARTLPCHMSLHIDFYIKFDATITGTIKL